MTKGLVGYWNFDEAGGTTAYDGSDYGNDRTLYNNPAWTAGAPAPGGGSQGTALQFDGVDDYVDCGSDNSLHPTDRTTELWVKLNTLPGAGELAMLLDYGGTSYEYYIQVDEDGVVFVGIEGGTAPDSFSSGATTLSAGKWYHIVLTHTSAKLGTLYIDSVYIDSETWASALDSSGTSLTIGSTGSTRWLDGLIDEVRIYNRALSEEEVRYHYNRGGPVAHWTFDEGNGTTTFDGTNNNNDGTLGDGTCSPGDHPSSCPAWTTGKFGSALSFDGVDDYVSVSYDSSLTLGSELSVSYWVKFNDLATEQQQIVSRADAGGWSSGYQADVANTQDHLYFLVRNSADTAYVVASYHKNNLVEDRWYHVVGTYKADDSLKLYVDGIEVDSESFSGTASDSPSTTCLMIGAEPGLCSPTAGWYFDGLIDDVKIYNYARTPEQIRIDYNAGLATHFK
jgi:hypothetical protein